MQPSDSPAPFSRDSGSPCPRPTSMRALVLCHCGRRHVRPSTCRASETGHRRSAQPEGVEDRRGPPRFLGRPLRACQSRTPRRIRASPGPHARRGRWGLPGKQPPGHPGRLEGSGPQSPWPTRAYASASPTPLPRPSQGFLPARAGAPFAGRASHPLDDKQSFMKASQPPMPFDQPCLVALFFLSASRLEQQFGYKEATAVLVGWQAQDTHVLQD